MDHETWLPWWADEGGSIIVRDDDDRVTVTATVASCWLFARWSYSEPGKKTIRGWARTKDRAWRKIARINPIGQEAS